MRKSRTFRYRLMWCLILLIFVLPAGCRKDRPETSEAPEAGAVSAPAETRALPPLSPADGAPAAEIQEAGELKILRFGPEGEVKKLNQVVAMFSQPMVALGDYLNVPEGALTVEPPVEGQSRWLNQYTLAFVPAKPLTGSLELKATLNADRLKSLAGTPLAEGAAVDIALPELGVVQAYRLGGPDLDEDRALTPRWRAAFNQEPDLGSLAAKARFVYSQGGKETAVPAEVTRPEGAAEGTTFDFTARRKLPRDVKFRLELEAGVKSLAGPRPAPQVTVDEGATFGPLAVRLAGPDEKNRLNPAHDLALYFSNPVKIADILPHLSLDNGYDLGPVLAEFSPPEDGAAEADDGYEVLEGIQDYLFLPGGLKAGTKYTLTLGEGANDIFGQSLGRPFQAAFTTEQYETYLNLDEDLGLLETSSKPEIRLTASNIKQARLEGYALDVQKAIEFLAAGEFSPRGYSDVLAGEAVLGDLKPLRLDLAVPDGARHGPVNLAVDLKKMFGDRLTGRLLYVRAAWKSKDPHDNQTREGHSYARALVTDVGLAFKVGPASSLIWTTNLAEGRAWAGVDLEVRDRGGRVLWSGRSDEHGLATLPGSAEMLAAAPDKEPSFFVAAKAEGQLALWNVDWNDGLEAWRWNVDYGDALGREDSDAHWIVNALPLYKPGETAKFKIIARRGDGDRLRDLAGEKLLVQLRDANDEVVDSAEVTTGPFGTAAHEYRIPAEPSLGGWSIHLGRPGDKHPPYAGQFMVLTYRAPALEINLGGRPENPVAGDKVALQARADYHFGSPVAGQPARYSVSASPADFSLPGDFSAYTVVNRFRPADEYEDSGYGYQEPSVIVASDETALSREGGLEIPIDLSPAPGQKPRPRLYETSVTVTDVDQRQVSDSTSFLVHPASLYVGLHSDRFVTEAGRPFLLKAIVADHQGRLSPGREIKATLYRRVWQNVRRKSAGSAYEYVSRMVDEKVATAAAKSGELPAGLEFKPEKPGYYWVKAEIKDPKGRVNEAGYDFYVSGHGPVGWRLGNDDTLTLVADKNEYRPGETARIMVQSPFEQGRGLLTVERAGVRRAEVFDIDGSAPLLEVPLTEDDGPNVFVSVLLVRGRMADELDDSGLDFGKPAIRLGYTELKVPTRRDRLNVEVTPGLKVAAPGGEVEVTVAVTDRDGRPFKDAEVALIAADAAVIQLAGEETYHPGRLYHRDLPLLVQTADNLVSLLGRQAWGLKGGNPGGGGADLMAAAARAAGPDGVRRFFSSLAWFEPQVSLDDEGRAKVKMKMPENLTTFKIYAVATGHGRITGTGSDTVLVTRDLLARSALPNYAGAGDEFAAAMVVTNRGEGSGQAVVKLSGENFALLDRQPEKSVSLAAGESREVSFKVKAGQAGEAKFLFEVSMGSDVDRAEYVISVSAPNRLSTQAAYRRLEVGQWSTELALAEGLDLQRGGLEVELSPSLAGVMKEPFDWLRAYPHNCVEQTASRGFGAVVQLRLLDRLGQADREEEIRAYAQGIVNQLAKWEYAGGYNFWPDSHDWGGRSVYLTAYVLDFFLAARAEGLVLPDPGLSARLSGFLKGALSGDNQHWPKWYSEAAVRQAKSYVLNVLTRAGENVAAYVEVMYADRAKLGLFELVNLVRAVAAQGHNQQKAAQISELMALVTNHLQVTAGDIQLAEGSGDAPEIWGSSVRTTALALSALAAIDPDGRLYPELQPGLVRWLTAASRAGHFGTTQNNAVALTALADYVRAAEPENPDLTVRAFLGEALLAQAEFKNFTAAPVSGRASLEEAGKLKKPAVAFDVAGAGQAWASLRLKSALSKPDLSPATSGGFMVNRSFTVVSPKAEETGATHFKRGQVVRVSVTVLAPAPRNNLVLEDRVPAGFEPINFNLGDADRTLASLAGEDERWPVYWYNHQEIWPDRVAVYADHLDAGVYVFSYLARAVTPGAYYTPGPHAEEMYAPETYGRGAGQVIVVE